MNGKRYDRDTFWKMTWSSKPYWLAVKLYQMWSRTKMDQMGLSSTLLRRPAGAIPPDFADLLFLYQLIRKRKPKVVLEFGSGCSTILLAQALFDNERESPGSGGHIYSIDADPYWARATIESMPNNLVDLFDILYSPLEEIEYEGVPAFRHVNVPNIAPDFIYLDGPALTPERQVAIDVLDLEEKFHSGFFIAVDGRRKNVAFLEEHLKKRYICIHRGFFRNTTFELID